MSFVPPPARDDSSLKAAQVRAVHRMLAFNEDDGGGGAAAYGEDGLPPAGSAHNQWKVLIYDATCRAIISPILSVPQLRRRGVTLHLPLEAEREPVPDVPALYFCRPTRENLARIARDCSRRLYGPAHLNFVARLGRADMEEFARLVVQAGALETIASVHDQYLDFVCLERRLFSLGKPDSYALYNGRGATEQMMDQCMTEIAYGLFSVVASMGHIPIIRCPHGGAPEMVARKLNQMIVEHPTLLRNKSSMARPLLVILDRNADLITPVQHTSTYQALIDDLLVHRANRVEFEVVQDESASRPKKVLKKYDLDPDQDPFYSVHKFQPFPEAIEQNGVELQEVTTREQAIRSKASGSGAGPVAMDPLASGATDLSAAVDSLPALLDRKKQLEVHTSILQAVMNEVAARDVPQFYELESGLTTGAYRNDPLKAKKAVLALVGDPAKGNVDDKTRLVIVYMLATAAKSGDLDEVEEALKQACEESAATDKSVKDKLAAAEKAFAYLKQLRSMQMIPAAADMFQELQSPTSTAQSATILSGFMAKATSQATGLLAKAADRVTSMLGKIHKNHATVVVENLCEMRPQTEDETYLYLDPKVKGDVDVLKLRSMTRATVKEVIAFTIGGGSYGEYQNLQMLANDRRTITYGSTEIVDASSFLAQLGKLG